jgi:microcystin-dependent protein
MGTPFIGEIRLGAFSVVPQGWAPCNGQLLSIAQNQPLFSIIGTTYGGDGRATFALPDLRGRVPLHPGTPGGLGLTGGEEAHVLSVGELPAHSHAAMASGSAASEASPVGHTWAAGGDPAYAESGNGALAPQAISPTGGGQAHENRQPYLVVNAIIALQGVFPTRD